MTKHTPTIMEKVTDNALYSLFGNDADYVRKAVNSHDELVEALRSCIEILESYKINCELPRKALKKASE